MLVHKPLLYFIFLFLPICLATEKLSDNSNLESNEGLADLDVESPRVYPVKRKTPLNVRRDNENEYSREIKEFNYLGNGGYNKRIGRDELSSGLYKPSASYYSRLWKRDADQMRNGQDAFGIVYRNGRPLGLLQPLPQAYEFLPVIDQRDVHFQQQQQVPQGASHDDNYYSTDVDAASKSKGSVQYNEEAEDSSLPKSDDRVNKMSSPQFERRSSGAKGSDDALSYSNSAALIGENMLPKTEERVVDKNSYQIDRRALNAKEDLTKREKKNARVSRRSLPAPSSQSKELVVDRRAMENSGNDKNQMRNPDFTMEDEDVLQDDGKKPPEKRREDSSISDAQVEELKSTLSRIQNPGPSDSVEEIERNLRSILTDMGLVADEEPPASSITNPAKGKRDTSVQSANSEAKEDEDMESGTDKIELSEKAGANENERKKREGISKKQPREAFETKSNLLEGNERLEEIRSNLDKKRLVVESGGDMAKVANYKTEGEAFVRKKRQDKKQQQDVNANNELMKCLEKSGELTVSGNKSPLASSLASGDNSGLKKMQEKSATESTGVFKRGQDELEYQKHVEALIQNRLNALKDEVKRELEISSTSPSSNSEKTDTRSKRDAAMDTLLDEEKLAQLNPSELHHGRVFPPLKRVKRALLDFSNLDKIDSGDYFEEEMKKREDKRATDSLDYQEDPQENGLLSEGQKNSLENLQEDKSLVDLMNSKGIDETLLDINKRDTATSNVDNNKEKVVEKDIVEKKSVSEAPVASGSTLANIVVTSNEANKNEEAHLADKVLDTDSIKDGEEKLEEKLEEKPEENPEEKRNANNAQVTDSEGDEYAGIKTAKEPQKNQEEKRNTDSVSYNNNNEFEQKSPAIKSANELKKIAKRAPEKKYIVEHSWEEFLPQPSNEKNLRFRRSSLLKGGVQAKKIRRSLLRRSKRQSDENNYSANMGFLPYRSEDQEVDDEGDEFDDDSLDDRTMEKRQAGNYDSTAEGGFYENPSSRFVSSDYYDYVEGGPSMKQMNKRSLGEQYVARINSDVYENPTNFLYYPDDYTSSHVRKKRQSFHGGGASLRRKPVVFESDRRNKRTYGPGSRRKQQLKKMTLTGRNVDETAPPSMLEISDEDLFGALPQSYDGELSRYKRVKRNLKRDRYY